MAAEAPRSVVEAEDAPESVVEEVAAQLALAAGLDAPGGVNGRDPSAAPDGVTGRDPSAAPDGVTRRDRTAAPDGVTGRDPTAAPDGVTGRDPSAAAARPEGAAPGEAGAGPDSAPAADGAAAGSGSSGRPTDIAAVAEAAVTGGGAADPPHFAAAAVLDVLRATGWADAAEAEQLRAEVERLRELLDMVIRDHRARVASAAGVENQQLHWLVPLLRSAYGVAFGTLGAKVALRTAIQEVPPEVLASAGLRLDQPLVTGSTPNADPHPEQ